VSETNLPRTMRASVLSAPKKVVVEERPVPRPGPREVLVEVGSVGVCGSDVHYYEHGRIGEFVVRRPLVLGHEAGGRIVATGEGVDETRVGQRVAIEPGVPCRRCRYCRAGRYNLCPDVRFFATPPVDGAFCEYVVIADDFAHVVPDSLSDDAAGLVEPLSVGVWACRTARVASGGSLLVAGAGPIGLLVAQVARAVGVTQIVVSDIDEQRRGLAERLGATAVLDPSGDAAPSDLAFGDGFDAFVDCSGAPAAILAGLPAVRPGGAVVLVGMDAEDLSIPVPLIQTREITLTGTFRYANTYPEAIALAASGRVDLDALVTGRVDLDHVEEALVPAPGSVKTVVRPRAVR
jgi:L-iditol 2-dehydrogenase